MSTERIEKSTQVVIDTINTTYKNTETAPLIAETEKTKVRVLTSVL